MKIKILDGFHAVDDKMEIRYNQLGDPIETKLGKKDFVPYTSKSSIFSGTVYSVYGYRHGENTTEYLKSIKGIGKYKLDEKDFKRFIVRTAIYCQRILRKEKIDIVLSQKSKSGLLDIFMNEISKRNPHYKIYPNSIHKTKEIEMKKIPHRLRKFETDFIGIDNDIISKIKDKNILIIDDILSSGTTLSEIMKEIRKNNPSNIIGITFFKNL